MTPKWPTGLELKGTISLGFCSFFCHNRTNNTRYQVNFRIDTKLLLVLSDFSKTQQYNLKTLAQLFQVAIHFHPGHPQLKTRTDSFRKRSGFLKHLTIKNCDKTFRKSILKFVDDVSTFG